MKALLSSTLKFGGRSVIETSPILGSDTCYFTGSIFEKSQNVTGGIWYVQNDNTYQTDYVGPFPEAVGYHQTYGPAKWGGGDHSLQGCPGTATSCSICINQQMQMSSPSGFQNYGSPNLLQITITQTGVTASRANATGNRTYSFQ